MEREACKEGAAPVPQDKRYRSGSAAAGGGMLTLWLTMRANAWLRQEWLSLLTETAAEGIGLVLQFLMLGIPLVVTIELLRRSAAQPCPLREGQNGSLWLVPAGLAVLLGANFLTLLLQDMLTGSGMSTPTPLPEEPLAIIFSAIGSILVPAVMEELLFRGAVLHAAPGRGKAGDMALRTVIYGGTRQPFPMAARTGSRIGAGDRDLLYRNAALGYLDPPV